MYRTFEGEILLKETYGTTTKERYYVKPPDQSNVVVVEEGKLLNVYNWLLRVFLPHGYPHTVSKDYAAYQIWDTAQAFCSTITGTLATQEVLRGVGVGDTNATPLAATITWVIKDGCGHLGRIFFACTHGTHLDAYSKKWRLYADVLNDAAMCIEISLPLFKNYTTTALCVSTAMKAIVGVAGGATRVALTQHHALCGNMADVAAKDSAQETAVNLVASVTALVLITVFGNSVTLFLFMMVLHITFNYLAVRAVCLRTFNEPRFLQVISAYIRKEIIASPCEVNRHEPVVLYKTGNNNIDVRLCGFRIKVGYSLKKITQMNPKFEYLNNIRNNYAAKNYLLYPNIGEQEMYVLLSDEATAEDTLCAYFHAVLLATAVSAINTVPLAVYENNDDIRPFGLICQTLQAADWSREPTATVGFSGFLYEPSTDLQLFFNSIVKKEWIRFKAGLIHVGWDISKHLLLSEEWRISHHTINPKERSVKQEGPESGTLLADIPNLNDGYLNYAVAGDFVCEPFVIEPDSLNQSTTSIETSVRSFIDKPKHKDEEKELGQAKNEVVNISRKESKTNLTKMKLSKSEDSSTITKETKNERSGTITKDTKNENSGTITKETKNEHSGTITKETKNDHSDIITKESKNEQGVHFRESQGKSGKSQGS